VRNRLTKARYKTQASPDGYSKRMNDGGLESHI